MTGLLRAAATRAWRLAARGLTSVLDSPVSEMDVRGMLASWRVGFWLAGLTACLSVLAIIAILVGGEDPFRQVVAQHGMGALLLAAMQLGGALFLTFAIPIRTLGLTEGPRWRGYYDQLVVSGVAPWRYFAGRWLVSQGFILVVLLATVPPLVLFALVDPPPLGQVLSGHAFLVVYAELLLAATLGLGAMMHELFAVAVTVVNALAFAFMSFMPLPSVVAAISPVRGIIGPLAASLFDFSGDVAILETLYGPPSPFGFTVPTLAYSSAVSLLLGGLALLSCVTGPLHAFTPGFNSFGAVILPGDSRRAVFRRIRPFLSRRNELAFFFENRGPRLDRLAPWIRALQIGVFLFVQGAIVIAASLSSTTLGVMKWPDSDALLAFAVFPCAGLGLTAYHLLATGRNDARASLRLGRLSIPVVVGDVALYILVAAALVLVYDLALWEASPLLPRFLGRGALATRSLRDLFAISLEWNAVLALVGLTLVLLQKLVGLLIYGRWWAAIGAALIVGATSLPLLGLNSVDFTTTEVTHAEDGSVQVPRTPEQNARLLATFHVAFPLRLMLSVEAKPDASFRIPPAGAWRFLALDGFWVLWPTVDLLLLSSIVRLTLKRRRDGAALEAVPPTPTLTTSPAAVAEAAGAPAIPPALPTPPAGGVA